MSTYYVCKGSTSDVTSCDICGREDLRKTVILHQIDKHDNNFVQVTYAGVDCAARVTDRRQHEMTQIVRNMDRQNRNRQLNPYRY